MTCFIGIVLILICSLLFWLEDVIYGKNLTSIIASIFLGSGSTIVFVATLSITTDLIGKNTGSGEKHFIANMCI
jgi:hypothetical protein